MNTAFQRLCCSFGLVLLALVPRSAQDNPKTPKLEGVWLATLKDSSRELRLGFHVVATAGKLTATMDSIDQGANGIPIKEVTYQDGTVRFDLPVIKASFEGKINKEGTEIAGEWKATGKYPLTLKRVDKLPTARRPQEPKRPLPYREEEITYENKKAKVIFAGTLTLPKGEGPFPAVLMITGSGPQNRDEEADGHKPFLVIADYLTRRGIADLKSDEAFIKEYAKILPTCDVALWILDGCTRTLSLTQMSLRGVVSSAMSGLDRLVIGINKIDAIEPGDWNIRSNRPSAGQQKNIKARTNDVKQRLGAAVDIDDSRVVAFSARKNFQLGQLLNALMDACPRERRWVLHDRVDLAKYEDLVDPAILKALRDPKKTKPSKR
jgi:hypothetical protein